MSCGRREAKRLLRGKKIKKALVVFFSGRKGEGKSVCVCHCLLFVAAAALVYQFVFIMV